jgi:RNA polymerase sigma-54 factor
VVAILHTFDPAGVCARNLTECLAIQLRDRNRYDPAMAALLSRLDLLAKRDFSGLRKLCGVNEEDLADMVAEIKRLNPKPGLAFGSTTVQPIVPDVFVRQTPDGAFAVELNSDTVTEDFCSTRPTTRAFPRPPQTRPRNPTSPSNCSRRLGSFARLDQRARTILKVATEIVKQQDGFFVHGVQHLRRSISRPCGTPSRCMNRRFHASPPINIWRPAAASSN